MSNCLIHSFTVIAAYLCFGLAVLSALIYLYFEKNFSPNLTGFQKAYLRIRYKIICGYNFVGLALLTTGLILGVNQAIKIGISFEIKFITALIVWFFYLSLFCLIIISKFQKINRQQLISKLSLIGLAIIFLNFILANYLGSAHPFK